MKYCQSSFERQVLESVLIQSERKHHNILNSRSEYNRCSLPRLSTKMGEDSYKEFGQEIENEKNGELRIKKKIRELRKEKNKARLHPTKEVGPKRRKINEQNNYITINEIWGKPPVATQIKNKHENQIENKPSKKPRITCWEDAKKETPTNTNIAEIENTNETKNQEQDAELEKIFQQKEHSTEHGNINHPTIQKNELDQLSWELLELCQEYLQKNDTAWKKRKLKRQEEKERLERLEKAKIKSKEAKMKHIEKNIEEGMKRIPETERNNLL